MLCLTNAGLPGARIGLPDPSKAVIVNDNLADAAVVASLIDHTLLKPDASAEDIARLCGEAKHALFAAVCVNPYWVPFAAGSVAGSPVRVCTVIGFPLGANQSHIKLAEAQLALTQGARELDMVQNIGALRSKDHAVVRDEIAQVARLAHSKGAILKVILETGLLTDEQKTTACQLAVEANADFVKTSTGSAGSGAVVGDVALMRQTVGGSIGVKASGGIRTLTSLCDMVRAGASRIGTSAGVAILTELAGGEPSGSPKHLNAMHIPGGNPDTY